MDPFVEACPLYRNAQRGANRRSDAFELGSVGQVLTGFGQSVVVFALLGVVGTMIWVMFA